MASNHVPHAISVKIRAQNSVQPRPENTDHEYYSFPYARLSSPDGEACVLLGFTPWRNPEMMQILSCLVKTGLAGCFVFFFWGVRGVGMYGTWGFCFCVGGPLEVEMLRYCVGKKVRWSQAQMGRGPVIFYALTLAVSGSSVRLPRPFMRDFVVSFNLVWLIDTQDTSYINRFPGMDILRSTMQILGLLCTIQE